MSEQGEQGEQEELDTDFYENLTENRLWVIPDFALRCIGTGVIFKLTPQYGYTKSAGGLFIPNDKKFEKKYFIGEVTHLGESVNSEHHKVEIGDIVIANKATCFRLPNGMYAPVMYRTNADTNCIIAVMPNLDPEKRVGGRWNAVTDRVDFKELEASFKARDQAAPDVTRMRDIFKASVGATAPEAAVAES